MNAPHQASLARRLLARSGPWMLLACAGCHGVGAHTVPRDRFEYSHAISESWKRQTLLNIVKLRYLDPPIFVDVGQIVAGYSLETALSAGVSLPEEVTFGGDTFTLGGLTRFTDRPTVTYTPLTGSRFIKGMMTPMPLEAIFHMIQSGWPADSLFAAAVASLNGLRNQETSLGGVSEAEPGFLRVCQLLREVQLSGAVAMRVQPHQEQRQKTLLSLRAKEASEQTLASLREMRELLGLAEAEEFELVFGATAADEHELAVVTRSVLHVMQSIATYVDVPARHLSEGRATPGHASAALLPDNAPPPVRISSSSTEPTDAFALVRYRDHWFWIDDRDLHTKRAFALIMFLFTLAETGERQGLPLLTIPTQ